MWMLGVTAGDDYGDPFGSGGSNPSVAYGVGDASQLWLQECKSRGVIYGTYVDTINTGAQIFTRAFVNGGALSSGSVSGY
jgi:hypothetical protein